MSNRWVRMLLVAAVGVLALAGKNLVERGGFGVLPLSPTAQATHDAVRAYSEAQAKAADEAAADPLKTMNDITDRIYKTCEPARDEYRKALNKIQVDALGSGDVDSAKAKTLYAEMAKGFRQ